MRAIQDVIRCADQTSDNPQTIENWTGRKPRTMAEIERKGREMRQRVATFGKRQPVAKGA